MARTKITALALAGLIAVLALTACSSSQDEPTPDGAATADAAADGGDAVAAPDSGPAHPWITGDHTIERDGVTYRAIDDEGVYFVDLAKHQADHPDVPLPEPKRTLRQIYGPRATIEPIVVTLQDHIRADQTDHGFTDDNLFSASPHPNKPSRLVEVGGQTFRVTAAPDDGFATHYFIYDLATGPAGTPHLLQAESINDRERYTSLILNSPDGGEWNEPYQDEPINPWDDGSGQWWKSNPPCIQQGLAFEPGVGVTFYTGRELPIDQRPYLQQMVFYPKSAVTRLMVSSLGCNEPRTPDDGGAVSQVWLWRWVTPLADSAPTIEADAATPARHVGIYMPHSWFLYAHYGTPVRTEQQRHEGLTRLCQHLKASGLDWLEFNAINGSDRSEKAWYEGSEHFPWNCAGDLLAELPPIAEGEGINVVPVITSLIEPPDKDGIAWSGDSFQIGSDGNQTYAFGKPLPDPLRPEVQETIFRLIDEIASRAGGSTAVRGVGIRVSGKIGLAYAAHADGLRGSRLSGYSSWNLQQFRDATGIEVPTAHPHEGYAWLAGRPEDWKAWIDYRCNKMRDFWLAARDRLRAHRDDLTLYVKTVLPSEVPGTNIEWPEGEDPIELLRHAGYDPKLFEEDEGIVIERTMMVAADRFYTRARWTDPWGKNHEAYRDFHYQPDVARAYVTAEGQAVDLYHNYWEEAFNPFWEYGVPNSPAEGWFRTTTPTPFDRSFFRPVTFSLRTASVDLVVLTGWQRATLGQEHRLRHFARALRALPAVAPRDFDGSVEPPSETLWVGWFGDRLAVVNDDATARQVSIELAEPLAAGKALYDLTHGQVAIDPAATDRSTFTLSLQPWSLRVLGTAD